MEKKFYLRLQLKNWKVPSSSLDSWEERNDWYIGARGSKSTFLDRTKHFHLHIFEGRVSQLNNSGWCRGSGLGSGTSALPRHKLQSTGAARSELELQSRSRSRRVNSEPRAANFACQLSVVSELKMLELASINWHLCRPSNKPKLELSQLELTLAPVWGWAHIPGLVLLWIQFKCGASESEPTCLF